MLLGAPFLYGQKKPVPVATDSSQVTDTSTPKKKKGIRSKLPRFMDYNGKSKFYLWLPWREVYIAAPRAFVKAPPRPPYDPEIAWQRSIFLPGWGQAYNRSYWKMPIIYATYGGLIWWISWNHQNYQTYRDAYILLTDEDPDNDPTEYANIDPEGVRTQRENYRRNRDFSIILIVIVHALQTVEAYVDAHLKGFDVSDDLTLQASPTLVPTTRAFMQNGKGLQANPGLRLSLNF